MSRKLVIVIVLITVLISILFSVLKIQRVEAGGTIYIRVDGSIDPPDAPIQRYDDLFIFTGDIDDSIVAEKGNIVIDGAGYTLHGNGSGNGFSLAHIENVTIKNTNIEAFENGIHLSFSSKNTFLGNNLRYNNGFGVYLYQSSDNTISGSNITNNVDGIAVYYSSDNTISGNNVVANDWYGIEISFLSNHNRISGNTIVSNNYGIYLDNSSGNTISLNEVTNNDYSIHVAWGSSGNTVSGNNVTNNDYGVYLRYSANNTLSDNMMNGNRYNFGVTGYELHHFLHSVDVSNLVDGKPIYYWLNWHGAEVPLGAGYIALVNCTEITVRNLTLKNSVQGMLLACTQNSYVNINTLRSNYYGVYLYDSSNNTISSNSVANNWDGIFLDESSSNFIYHNNFINNTRQVYDYSWDLPSVLPSINTWNKSYAFGGNYWSDYDGTDVDHNGLGDVPYVIGASNQDNYPLMGMFSSFDTCLGYHVNAISNSTLDGFEYLESDSTIKIQASNMTADQTHGFCRLTIHHDLLSPPYNVTINKVLVPHTDLYENDALSIIYFGYRHSTLEIVVVPEFPSFLITPPFMMATLVTVIVYRRKYSK